MNNDKSMGEYTIYCSRCGAEMKNTQRYCMKCGNLNYNHADNESMKEFAPKEQTSYEVGSGKNMNETQNTQVLSNSINKSHQKSFCFLLNIFLYFLFVVLSFFSTNSLSSISFNSFLTSNFSLSLIGFSFLFMYSYAIQLIFIKANQKWWTAFIPIYNILIMGDIIFHKKVLGLIFIIPVIGQLILFYKLGEKFQYSGILTVLFAFIYIPIIAYGSHYYEKKVFVDNYLNNKEVERDYFQRKFYITIVMIGIILGSIILIYTNLSGIKSIGKSFGNYYFVFASKQLVLKTKSKIKNKSISNCSLSSYQDNQGVYYVYVSDLGSEVYLPLYYIREPIEAYIKIDNTGKEKKFYVSMTDGSKGFEESLYEDINTDSVKSYSNINFSNDKNKENICQFES